MPRFGGLRYSAIPPDASMIASRNPDRISLCHPLQIFLDMGANSPILY